VALPWVIASVIVLAVSVTAGFVTAYLVASGRAVQPPGAGLASPTPGQTAGVTLAPGETAQASGEPTTQPRRTPTPVPEITPEASPFVHVVQRRESLSYIAGLYCTTVDAILAINDIPNPDTIRPGDEILIPGSASCSSPAP
jgi:LysM repeat protein